MTKEVDILNPSITHGMLKSKYILGINFRNKFANNFFLVNMPRVIIRHNFSSFNIQFLVPSMRNVISLEIK